MPFDAAAAGWKRGKSPFGQYQGKLPRGAFGKCSAQCKGPVCFGAARVRTLWDEEVLLMRGTFEIPKLKEGQTWEDVPAGSDSNMVLEPRQILVEKIKPRSGIALCTVQAPAVWKQKGTRKQKTVGRVGRHLEIRIDRFRPVRGGYNLLD